MNKYKFSLFLNIVLIVLLVFNFYPSLTSQQKGMQVEGYIIKSSRVSGSIDDMEMISDFYHYSHGIENFCTKNNIEFKVIEVENTDFVGYKIQMNNKVFFYSGVNTAFDFIEAIKKINPNIRSKVNGVRL